MSECENPECECHGPDVEMPAGVLARLDQVIAELTDERKNH